MRYGTVWNIKTYKFHLLRYIHLNGNSNTDLTFLKKKTWPQIAHQL
jgi:hypothetical protein